MKILNGAGELGAWLGDIVTHLQATLRAGLVHLKGMAARYPPEIPYTGNRGYTRGVGPWYRRKDGSLRQYKTSETLGRQWNEAEPEINGLVGTVGNRASYGPFVQGDRQTALHKQRGWQTLPEIVEREKPRIVEFFMARLRQLLGGGA